MRSLRTGSLIAFSLIAVVAAACSVTPAAFVPPGCAEPALCPPMCGNGVIDPGEQCDDGNAINGDACEADCTLPGCGA